MPVITDPAPLPFIAPFLRAVAFAQAWHGDQVDKAGDPYICHCVRVGAALLPDLNAAVVGVLHDVLEDTSVTEAELGDFLEVLFAGSDLAAALTQAVVLLTRKEGTAYEDYIAALAPHYLARRVKLADLTDNLNPFRMQRAFARTHVSLGPLAERYRRAQVVLTKADETTGDPHAL